MRVGKSFCIVISLPMILEKFAKTSTIPTIWTNYNQHLNPQICLLLTDGFLSLASACIWGKKALSLSTGSLVKHFERLNTASTLTSFSESFSKVVKIWAKNPSQISFPKASAMKGRFFESAWRIFQESSSLAAKINGRICILFSSLVRSLMTVASPSKHNTLTGSYNKITIG